MYLADPAPSLARVLLNPFPKENTYSVKFAGLLAERVLKCWKELGNCKRTEREILENCNGV